jgi:hypothetical protein
MARGSCISQAPRGGVAAEAPAPSRGPEQLRLHSGLGRAGMAEKMAGKSLRIPSLVTSTHMENALGVGYPQAIRRAFEGRGYSPFPNKDGGDTPKRLASVSLGT